MLAMAREVLSGSIVCKLCGGLGEAQWMSGFEIERQEGDGSYMLGAWPVDTSLGLWDGDSSPASLYTLFQAFNKGMDECNQGVCRRPKSVYWPKRLD